MLLLSMCDKSYMLEVFLIIKIFLELVCYIVPLIIIIVTIVNLFKTIQSGKQDDMKDNLKLFTRRIIAGLLVIFVPTLVNYLFTNLIDGSGVEIVACMQSATKEKVESLKEAEEAEDKAKSEAESKEAEELEKEAYEEAHKNDSTKKENFDNAASERKQSENSSNNNGTGAGSSTGTTSVVSTSSENVSIKKFSAENGVSFQYYEIKPSNTAKNLPLIIFLHGSGEVGSMSGLGGMPIVTYVSENKAHIGEDFVFIAPNNTSGSWVSGGTPAALKGLIDSVVNEYDIDKDRIIITGMSLGAIGTWNMVATYGTFFSAAVPMSCCASNSNGSAYVGIPIYAMVGSTESSYLSCMTSVVNNINAAGGNATIKSFSGATHSTMQQNYKDPSLFNWMLSQ